MPIENTDLERRVLAHEQILKALIAQLAEHQPGFLDRMLNRFAGARRGAHEHEYVETADYAETFLHEVMRLVRSTMQDPYFRLRRPPQRFPARSRIPATSASPASLWRSAPPESAGSGT